MKEEPPGKITTPSNITITHRQCLKQSLIDMNMFYVSIDFHKHVWSAYPELRTVVYVCRSETGPV